MTMKPGKIQKLEKQVVNRIAAGEIIQRPASALKELMENSLDASATYIQIECKLGGLKLLKIQDNGTGIRREDLKIICERFTTSKIVKYDDLSTIATFGFRGEALSSMAHIAHLTIQTKTAQDCCGYRGFYENGVLKENPKPCALNQGTIICIENLFYNMPQRRQCLRSPAEEYQKICDVVSKYAIHNSHVTFLLKKSGEQPTLKTNANSSKEQNIQSVYGTQIGKNLIDIDIRNDRYVGLQVKGLISTVYYAGKKCIFVLFINNRLVDCDELKTAVDNVYSSYLSKGTHPFVYIALEMDTSNLDVNVDPTKNTVHFLYQSEIISLIRSHIEIRLLGSNSIGVVYKQLKLPGIRGIPEKLANCENIYDKHLIRTDARERKLDTFFVDVKSAKNIHTRNSTSITTLVRHRKDVRLTSVLNMRKDIEANCDISLRKAIKEMVFVGIVNKTFALIQFEKSLLLCNTLKFSEELFYQRLVYGFQNFSMLKLEPKLAISELILVALNGEECGWIETDGDKNELSAHATNILRNKASIMGEYFGLHINEKNELESLPILLQNHYPCITFLGNYLLRLASEVNWEKEEICFKKVCRETAKFYARILDSEFETEISVSKWTIEHVVYPAFKKYLFPSTKLGGELSKLTNLQKLYRVFERC